MRNKHQMFEEMDCKCFGKRCSLEIILRFWCLLDLFFRRLNGYHRANRDRPRIIPLHNRQRHPWLRRLQRRIYRLTKDRSYAEQHLSDFGPIWHLHLHIARPSGNTSPLPTEHKLGHRSAESTKTNRYQWRVFVWQPRGYVRVATIRLDFWQDWLRAVLLHLHL